MIDDSNNLTRHFVNYNSLNDTMLPSANFCLLLLLLAQTLDVVVSTFSKRSTHERRELPSGGLCPEASCPSPMLLAVQPTEPHARSMMQWCPSVRLWCRLSLRSWVYVSPTYVSLDALACRPANQPIET